MLDILAPPGRLAGAVRQGPADALRRRRARLRRGRPEAGAAGLRRRRARRRRDVLSPRSPTTRSRATSRPSTRRCAGCTPPGSAPASRRYGRRRRAAAAPRQPRATSRAGRRLARRRRPARWRRGRLGPGRGAYRELGHLFADFLERRRALIGGRAGAGRARPASRSSSPAPRSACPARSDVFDDANVGAHPRTASSSST